MPLIPALGRQRQEDFWVQGQPPLQSEFQDSQGYTEKPCLEKPKKKKKKDVHFYYVNPTHPWQLEMFPSFEVFFDFFLQTLEVLVIQIFHFLG
jgi:hypothetical protein